MFLDFRQVLLIFAFDSIAEQNKRTVKTKCDARELAYFTVTWKKKSGWTTKNYYQSHNFYCALIHQWLWVTNAIYIFLLIQLLRVSRCYQYSCTHIYLVVAILLLAQQPNHIFICSRLFFTTSHIHMVYPGRFRFSMRKIHSFRFHLGLKAISIAAWSMYQYL